jgi:predicted nucleic acid-binding protein
MFRDWLESLDPGQIRAQEFYNLTLNKWETPMSSEAASVYLHETLHPLRRVYPVADIVKNALRKWYETQYQIYDCLIVAVAIHVGVRTLYINVMQEGREFGSITIRYHFA